MKEPTELLPKITLMKNDDTKAYIKTEGADFFIRIEGDGIKITEVGNSSVAILPLASNSVLVKSTKTVNHE